MFYISIRFDPLCSKVGLMGERVMLGLCLRNWGKLNLASKQKSPDANYFSFINLKCVMVAQFRPKMSPLRKMKRNLLVLHLPVDFSEFQFGSLSSWLETFSPAPIVISNLSRLKYWAIQWKESYHLFYPLASDFLLQPFLHCHVFSASFLFINLFYLHR